MALAAVLAELFAPGIVRGVEAAFKGLPKSGPFKLTTVIRMLGQVAENMLGAKAPLPDGSFVTDKSVTDELLKGIAETTLAHLKATGTLEAPPSISGGLIVIQGTVLYKN
jgi:hypothetical protein